MKRYGFLAGILLASIAFLAMGKTYITHVGQDWLIENATIRNCDITGSIGTVYGRTYYCNANQGSDDEDGRSWDTATKTLAQAMLLTHTYIGSRGHATERCIIYYTNDGEAENLTTMARKTDIIGVGSDNADKRARIVGHHIIPSTTDYAGCRFYNICFQAASADGVNELFHIDTQAGLEFHNCSFEGGSSAATDLLKFEECQGFVVDDCVFYGYCSIAAINVMDDTDDLYKCMITNNRIIGVGTAGGGTTGIGIFWEQDVSYNCWITDNYIFANGMPIDDDGDDVFIVNNILITYTDTSTYTNGWDGNLFKAANNILVGSSTIDEIPDVNDGVPD